MNFNQVEMHVSGEELFDGGQVIAKMKAIDTDDVGIEMQGYIMQYDHGGRDVLVFAMRVAENQYLITCILPCPQIADEDLYAVINGAALQLALGIHVDEDVAHLYPGMPGHAKFNEEERGQA